MNKKIFFLAPLVIAALMAGCGGSDSSDAPTPAPTSTPTPTPRPTPAPTPTPSTPSASFAYEGRWQMACHISSSSVQAGQVTYKSSISDVTITRRPDGLYAWTETERKYLKGAIGEAGNLEQSIGAVDTVFKTNAAQMHEWAKGAQNSVGLSRDSYNQLATSVI